MPVVPILMVSCLAMNPAADHITTGDLAPAFLGLTAIPADTPLAVAPAPGVARVFRVPELAAVAANLHVEAPKSEICVQRTVAPLDPAHLLAAMQKALPAARVEILDFSRRPVPEGELEFSVSGLRQGPAGAFWNGNVRYGGGHLFSIWAKVAVLVKVRRAVAMTDIGPGTVIEGSQIRVETRDEFPSMDNFAESADQVTGQLARTLIRAGTPIRMAQLEPPKEVLNGETVTVSISSGAAHLKLQARAEGSGALGQTIFVRNMSSQKRFLARVEGKGRVSVDDSTETNRNNHHEETSDTHRLVSAAGPAAPGKEKD